MNGDVSIGDTDLHVAVNWQEDRAIVAVTGEVDLASAPRLSAALDEVTANLPRSVEVDLSTTSFFACRGLSVLMAAHERLAERGAVLVVRGVSRVVRRVFTATGLDGLLAHDDRDPYCGHRAGRPDAGRVVGPGDGAGGQARPRILVGRLPG